MSSLYRSVHFSIGLFLTLASSCILKVVLVKDQPPFACCSMLAKLKEQIGSTNGLAMLTVVFLLGILSDEVVRIIATRLTGDSMTAITAGSHPKMINAIRDRDSGDENSLGLESASNQRTHSNFSDIFQLDATQTTNKDDQQSTNPIDTETLTALEAAFRSLDELKVFKLDTALVLRPGSPEHRSLYEHCHAQVSAYLTDKTLGAPTSQIILQAPSQWVALFLPKERLYAVFTLAHYNGNPRQVACVLDLKKKLKTTRLLTIPQSTNPDIFTSYAQYILNTHPERVLY